MNLRLSVFIACSWFCQYKYGNSLVFSNRLFVTWSGWNIWYRTFFSFIWDTFGANMGIKG